MEIIPVLDVLGGQVVRGIAGRRSEYRPIVSRLTTSTLPLAVAQAFRDHFGLTTHYLADLDAIGGGAPSLALYRELTAHGFTLWIDAGVTTMDQARTIAAVENADVVFGLETIAGPAVLPSACQVFGAQRVVFSLDLKAGRCLGDLARWPEPDPAAVADHAIAQGVRRVIVLDLAQVGTGQGSGTEALCQQLRAQHPTIELIAGGGVRDQADLARLAAAGVDAALVASALHDGRLTIHRSPGVCA